MEILNYKLLNRIYQNGYYDLWEAENNLGQRAIAKVAKESFSAHPGVNSAFKEEAVSLSKFQHPYVVQILGFDNKNGSPALLTAITQSESIKTFVQKNGPLKEQQAVAFILKLLDAMQSLNSSGISNFQLFFENVFITKDLNPLITGLGHNPESILGFGGRYSDDQEERIVFQSPENLAGNKTSMISANIYAAGVLLYYLLKGRLPVEIKNKSVQEIYSNLLKHNWTAIFNISEKTSNWLMNLTEVNPEKRYKDIPSAIEGLHAKPASTEITTTVICNNPTCKASLSAGVKFCGKCGTKQ